jgi:nitrile hydratase subunit beta
MAIPQPRTGAIAMSIDHPIGPHDIGGAPGPAVTHDEHEPALWERRVDAMLQLLRARGLLGLDEMRRHVEGLGESAYRQLEYYERWIAAMSNALLERGVISSDELGRRMAQIEARAR